MKKKRKKIKKHGKRFKKKKKKRKRRENDFHEITVEEVVHVHEIIVCEECEVKQCAFTCIQCEQNYCEPCLLKLHSRSKKFASHFWVPFTRVKTSRKNRNDRNQNWMNSLRN